MNEQYTVIKRLAEHIRVDDKINDSGIWETVTAVTAEDGFIAIETNLGVILLNPTAEVRVRVLA